MISLYNMWTYPLVITLCVALGGLYASSGLRKIFYSRVMGKHKITTKDVEKIEVKVLITFAFLIILYGVAGFLPRVENFVRYQGKELVKIEVEKQLKFPGRAEVHLKDSKGDITVTCVELDDIGTVESGYRYADTEELLFDYMNKRILIPYEGDYMDADCYYNGKENERVKLCEVSVVADDAHVSYINEDGFLIEERGAKLRYREDLEKPELHIGFFGWPEIVLPYNK